MLLHLGLHRFAPAFPNRQLDHEPSANPQNASYLAVASGLAAEWDAVEARRPTSYAMELVSEKAGSSS